MPGLPALAGVWGRIFVPGTRWLRRVDGSEEHAQLRFTAGGQSLLCHGTLHVRKLPFIRYKDARGVERHQGYRLLTGNDFRDLTTMLVVEFLPTEVLPQDLPAVVPARLEDLRNELLSEIDIAVLNASFNSQTVPFGTFSAAFTGGAELRAII
jgi:hypothetical protein